MPGANVYAAGMLFSSGWDDQDGYDQQRLFSQNSIRHVHSGLCTAMMQRPAKQAFPPCRSLPISQEASPQTFVFWLCKGCMQAKLSWDVESLTEHACKECIMAIAWVSPKAQLVKVEGRQAHRLEGRL